MEASRSWLKLSWSGWLEEAEEEEARGWGGREVEERHWRLKGGDESGIR